jgi:hypothetical protein
MFQIDSTVVDPVVYLAVDCSGAGPGDDIFRRDMARIADAVRSAEIEVVVFTFDAQARFAGRYGDDTLSRAARSE